MLKDYVENELNSLIPKPTPIPWKLFSKDEADCKCYDMLFNEVKNNWYELFIKDLNMRVSIQKKITNINADYFVMSHALGVENEKDRKYKEIIRIVSRKKELNKDGCLLAHLMRNVGILENKQLAMSNIKSGELDLEDINLEELDVEVLYAHHKKSVKYVVQNIGIEKQFYHFVFDNLNYLKKINVVNWNKIVNQYCQNAKNADLTSYEMNKYFGLDIYYEICKCYCRINEDINLKPSKTEEGQVLLKIIDLLKDHKKYILKALVSMVDIQDQHLRCGLIEYFYSELKRFCFENPKTPQMDILLYWFNGINDTICNINNWCERQKFDIYELIEEKTENSCDGVFYTNNDIKEIKGWINKKSRDINDTVKTLIDRLTYLF